MGVPHRFVGVVATVALAACGRIGFDETVTTDVGEQARATFAVGETTACAIRSGDVYCWGNLDTGQDGRGGTDVPALVPVMVVGLPKAVQIGVARYHACVVTVAGTVWCWGGDEYGRLGNSTATSRRLPGGEPTAPAMVPLPGPVAQVSVAHDHVCAVLESGAVWCWGRNHYGQLGRGFVSADTAGLAPAAALGISDATTISVEEESSCALRRNGNVACWGNNAQKMIDETAADVDQPRDVTGLVGAAAVATGGEHVCAIIGGRVACRGQSDHGELGNGAFSEGPITTPVVSTLDDYVGLDASPARTCAIRSTGEAVCWGSNDYGLLGDGTEEPRSTPTAVAQLADAIAIATSDYGTCAMRSDQSISCWGWGARGLVGDGRSAVVSARPVPVSGITSVTTGMGFTCASDGTEVWCWGANRDGQLGTGSVDQMSPQRLSFVWPTSIMQLVAGEVHACARLEDGSVYCWGSNRRGQLGDGTTTDHVTPSLVPLPPTFRLATGKQHTCALGTDGALRCWGDNAEGMIGDGTTTQRPTPTLISTGVDEVVAGDYHTCARTGGQVACWGANGGGELGDGTHQMRPSPTVVAGIVASAIAAGGRVTCAKDLAGVLCFGLNDNDVLDAPSAGYYQTTPVLSDQPALFSIGGSTACVGNTCWGSNRVGQAGTGGFEGASDPTAVQGLPSDALAGSVYAISASHTCAVVSASKSLWCWGENASGEIGVGSVSEPHAPVSTVAFP